MGRITLSHPLGSPFSSHAVTGFHKAGLLSQVVTGFCYKNNSTLFKVISLFPGKLRANFIKQLERRAWVENPDIVIREFPWPEFLRMALVKSGAAKAFGISFQKLTDFVYRQLDIQTANKIIPYDDIRAVYTYEDCAFETFRAAKDRGIKCIYDLPIMYYKESTRLEKEEANLFPEFHSALYAAKDSPDKLKLKENELWLADHVIVASNLTKNSLTKHGYPQKKITIVPYGTNIKPQSTRTRSTQEKFRVLFAGRIGPRKGVHYLLEAWKQANFKDAELCLVGIDEFGGNYLKQAGSTVKIIGSIPQKELYNFYLNSDLLVLPSIVEGFGMVLLEAMAHGLPVLATHNTAAPDILDDGIDGMIIPIRDIQSIKEKLTWAYENRAALSLMGEAAKVKAEKYSWQSYESSLTAAVRQIINS